MLGSRHGASRAPPNTLWGAAKKTVKACYGFHALTGNMRGRYAVSVSRNWRITFAWSDAIDVDLEDYHGK
jgi:plasmid maintenance system killer protein